ncbi:hypothetical protein UPYG_G00245620 [Umbra pygmaea]|uniref:Fibrinogen alpha/beta/gamma chain coiled coil domain-containing protein n=1 Tax=Umbra pygmaea TaxID=75934 RepID=A0ABD0WG68_UMBPY
MPVMCVCVHVCLVFNVCVCKIGRVCVTHVLSLYVAVCTRWMQQTAREMQQTAREMQQTARDSGWCPDRRDYPLCTDDLWDFRCPSGCRLQAMLEETERRTADRLRNICKKKQWYEDAVTTSLVTTKRIYDTNRKSIVKTYVAELRFVDFAERLAQNLTLLRKRSAALSQKLKEQRRLIQKQMDDMYRQEVDVDIKLRACRGSCKRTFAFRIDHGSYQSMQHLMTLFDNTTSQNEMKSPIKDIPIIKLQPVDVGPPPSIGYKTIPIVQKELLTQFEDLEQNQVVLDKVLEQTECPGSERETETNDTGIL